MLHWDHRDHCEYHYQRECLRPLRPPSHTCSLVSVFSSMSISMLMNRMLDQLPLSLLVTLRVATWSCLSWRPDSSECLLIYFCLICLCSFEHPLATGPGMSSFPSLVHFFIGSPNGRSQRTFLSWMKGALHLVGLALSFTFLRNPWTCWRRNQRDGAGRGPLVQLGCSYLLSEHVFYSAVQKGLSWNLHLQSKRDFLEMWTVEGEWTYFLSVRRKTQKST